MTRDQISAALDRLQALIQPADSAMDQLSALVRSHEGPLFDVIGRLIDAAIHTLAAGICASHADAVHALLQDWWLDHQFGANPLVVIIDAGPPQHLHSNAALAAFIAEVYP